MARKDRSFTSKDVIRFFNNNLDEDEKIKTALYFFLYLLGLNQLPDILDKFQELIEEHDFENIDLLEMILELIAITKFNKLNTSFFIAEIVIDSGRKIIDKLLNKNE